MKSLHRHTIFIIMAIFLLLATAGGDVFRPWWFDEVLTISNFALLDSPLKIYNSYHIPNNQIVHTICLHYLCQSEPLWGFLRFFPLFCALLTVGLLYRGFVKECGTLPLAAVLGAWMLSPPFMIYSTALRGYMLAALLVTLALLCGRKFAVSGKYSALAGWFICSLLAVGVMPSALAGIAAAGLFILPYFGKRFYRKRNFYLLALAPAAAFILFYAPIADDLRRAAMLREGWHCHSAALLAVAAALGVTYNLLIPAALRQILRSGMNMRKICYPAIWLLPLGMYCFPVAPFPRVWWVIFPVLSLTLARSLKNMPGFSRWYLLPVMLAFLTNIPAMKETISPWTSRAGQDDFFAPYFMRQDFVPAQAAEKAQALPHNAVYASFDSDPWALMMFMNEKLLFDPPNGKLAALPDHTAVILKYDENPATVTGRFGGTVTRAATAGRFTIYLWRK